MLPYFTQKFGNAASRTHAFGWDAERAVEDAREQVARLIGAMAKEIVWTSGATEANNLAIRGVADSLRHRGNHIVTSRTEHKSVLDTCDYLEKHGFILTYLPVNGDGRIDLAKLENALSPNTILVSIMLANNEIGVVQPVREIGELVKSRGILFHIDAVQGVGKVPFDVNSARADLVSISAHKMYGPKGIGALFVRSRPRVRLSPILFGGGHERGMRSGTLPVPLIVGFGKACELADKEMAREAQRILDLRELLRKRLWDALDGITLNGSLDHRLPGNLNVSFAGIESEALMMSAKEDIAISSGSACKSASIEPSYVLRACGVEEELAHASIRIGIGRFNTLDEIEHAASTLIDHVRRLREIRLSGEIDGSIPAGRLEA